MMRRNDVWESYKKKCLEKGLEPGTLEQYEARQEPLNFSSDLAIPTEQIKKEEKVSNVEWKRCSECGMMKEEFDFPKKRNGEYKDICKACVGAKISQSRQKKHKECKHEDNNVPKELTSAKNSQDEKVYIMDIEVFTRAILLAFKNGVSEGKSFGSVVRSSQVEELVTEIIEKGA